MPHRQQAGELLKKLGDDRTWQAQPPHYGSQAARKLLDAAQKHLPVSLPSISLPSIRPDSLKLPAVDLSSVQLPSLSRPSVQLPRVDLSSFGKAGGLEQAAAGITEVSRPKAVNSIMIRCVLLTAELTLWHLSLESIDRWAGPHDICSVCIYVEMRNLSTDSGVQWGQRAASSARQYASSVVSAPAGLGPSMKGLEDAEPHFGSHAIQRSAQNLLEWLQSQSLGATTLGSLGGSAGREFSK